MFTFINNQINFKKFLQELAEAAGVQVINNRVQMPEHIGTGYFAVEELPNGLLVLIIDYTLNTSLHFERPATNEEIYMLRFENIQHIKKFTTTIDDESHTEEQTERSIVYLTCSFFDLGFTASAGTYTNALSIQLPIEWLAKYLKMETYDAILEEYHSLKTAALLTEPLNASYLTIIEELKNLDIQHPVMRTTAHNRIMELIELFFTRLYEKRNQLKLRIKASAKDIESVRKIEGFITKNFEEPPATIDELSRMAAMSATKLKKLFKDIYDKPVYQYYQHCRLQKAKTMLLSGKHSVKETAMEIGYTSVSAFTNAFKKTFNILPGSLLA